jgi:hypothetical protein
MKRARKIKIELTCFCFKINFDICHKIYDGLLFSN